MPTSAGDAKAQIPRVEARCERGRVTQTQAAQPGADFHSSPARRPVRKPGFRGEVSAKQVRNGSRFRTGNEFSTSSAHLRGNAALTAVIELMETKSRSPPSRRINSRPRGNR